MTNIRTRPAGHESVPDQQAIPDPSMTDMISQGYRFETTRREGGTDSPERTTFFAQAVVSVLHDTYSDGQGGTYYPLEAKDFDTARSMIDNGKLDVIAAVDPNDQPVAVACLVHKATSGGRAQAIEVGRIGALRDVAQFSARGMIKHMLHAAQTDPTYFGRSGENIDYLDVEMRTATAHSGLPSSEGIQGVFFGGSQYGQDLGFGFANVGWRYTIGQTEPLTHIVRRLDQTQVPSYGGQMIIAKQSDVTRVQTFMDSALGTTPDMVVAATTETKPAEKIAVALHYNPDANSASVAPGKIQVLTNEEQRQASDGSVDTNNVMSLDRALRRIIQGGSPYVELTINTMTESDSDAVADIEQTLATLQQIGFTCTGWMPGKNNSFREPELVFGLLTRHCKGPVEPEYPKKYYAIGRQVIRSTALDIFADLRATRIY